MTLREEDKKRLCNFIVKYSRYFGQKEQIFWRYEFNPNKDYNNNIVPQVFTYLFPEYLNPVLKDFVDYIKSKFPNLTSRQILEIGSGYLPSLSLTIKKMMEVENTITCIDPLAMPIPIEGMVVEKAAFTATSDVSCFDLLIAHCPCEALDEMVKTAISRKKEICVQTCPCGHGFVTKQQFKYYIDSILDELKILEDDGFEIDNTVLDFFRDDEIPVISVRKREK